MSREVQMAYAAAYLAWQDAGLETAEADIEPDRLGCHLWIGDDHWGRKGSRSLRFERAQIEGDYHPEQWGKELLATDLPALDAPQPS